MAGIIVEAGMLLELVRPAAFGMFSVTVRLVPPILSGPSFVLGSALVLAPALSLVPPSLLGLIAGVRFVAVPVDDIIVVLFEQ